MFHSNAPPDVGWRGGSARILLVHDGEPPVGNGVGAPVLPPFSGGFDDQNDHRGNELAAPHAANRDGIAVDGPHRE